MGYPSGNNEGVPAAYHNNGTFVPDSAYAGGGYYSYPDNGTQYSYAELEALWIAAGGPPSAASNMAAIASQVESAGYNGAWNSSGATGLWQVEYPGSSPPGMTREELFSPLGNARAAVALYKSGGYSAWGNDINSITPHDIPPATGWPAPAGLPGGEAGGHINDTWLVSWATGKIVHETNGTKAVALELAGWKAFPTQAQAAAYAREPIWKRFAGWVSTPAEPIAKTPGLHLSNPLDGLGKFFGNAEKIFSPELWKKVGKYIVAALLVGFGFWLLFGGKGDTNITMADRVEKSAKTVGTVAAVAAA